MPHREGTLRKSINSFQPTKNENTRWMTGAWSGPESGREGSRGDSFLDKEEGRAV